MKKTWHEREKKPSINKSKKTWHKVEDKEKEQEQPKAETQQPAATTQKEEQPERKEPAVSPRVEKPSDKRRMTDTGTGGNAPRRAEKAQPTERRTGEERAERQAPNAAKEPKPQPQPTYSPVDALVETAIPQPEPAKPTMPPAVKPTSGYGSFMDDDSQWEDGVIEHPETPEEAAAMPRTALDDVLREHAADVPEGYDRAAEAKATEEKVVQDPQAEKEQLKQQREELAAQYNDLKYRFMNGRIWAGEGAPPETGVWYTPEEAQQMETMEAQLRDYDEKIAALQADVNAGEALGTNIMAGLERAGLGVTQGLDWLAGENSLPWDVFKEAYSLFTGKEYEGQNPVTALKNRGEEEVAYWQNRGAESVAGNDTWESVGQHAQSIAQSSPFIVLNLLTLGGAGGAAASTEGLGYLSNLFQSSGMQGISAMARQGMQTLASNPSAQYAFTTVFGSSYDEALKEGASPAEATLYAVLNGTFNSMIEVGGADAALGGMQALPAEVQRAMANGDRNFVLNWVKSTAGEINEEEWQGFIERGLKSIYTDVPLYSTEDQNAVFNPNVMLDTATNTFIDAGIMGGAQMAGQYGLNALANAAQNRQTPGAPTEAEALTPDAALAEAATPAEVAGIPAPDTSGEVTPLMETLAEARGEAPAAPVEDTRMSGIDRAEAAGPEVAAKVKNMLETAQAIRDDIAAAEESGVAADPVLAGVYERMAQRATELEEEAARLESEAAAASKATAPAEALSPDAALAEAVTGEETAEGVPVPPATEEASTEPVNEFNTDTATEASAETGTEAETPAPTTPREAADRLLSDTGSTSKASDIEAGLQEIADYVQSNNNGEGIDEAELRSKAEKVAADIIDNIPGEETGDRATYEGIKALLGKRGIEISDELRGDVADYNAWRKGLFGKLNLVKDGEAIDSIYSELSTAFPGLFPADVTSHSDMINRIVEVLDGTKPGKSTWADMATQEDYDAALAEMTQKVLGEAGALPSMASAVSEENFASLEGEAPPVMLDGQPTTPSTVEANGPTVERGFAENVRTTESTDEKLSKSLGKDKVTYERLLNKDVLARAQEIFDGGFDKAKEWLDTTIQNAKNGAKLPPEAVPLARMVANQMAADGEVVGAEQLIADVAAELTQAGQLGQVGKIMRQSIKTPEGKLYAMRRVVHSLNKQANGKYEVEIPKDLVKEYGKAKTDEARDEVITKIQKAVAEQIPATWMEKWNALRYTAMLGNLKTQTRNVLGNTAMLLNRVVKDRLAAVGELLAHAIDPNVERTKALFPGKDLYKAAAADFENVADRTMGEGKYSDATRSMGEDIDKYRKILPPGLEQWRKGTNWLMDMGDRIFNFATYTDALAGWLKAHKITAEQWTAMLEDPTQAETVERARAYAVQQAQEATFRDNNSVSDWVSKAGRGNTTSKFGKAMQFIGEGIAPFRKTPANIAVRAEEYSPLGILNTIYQEFLRENGQATASDVINQASKALTGTGVMALGMYLRSIGKIRGKSKDEDQENFDKLRGAQDYSWIGKDGTSFSLDWVAPSSIELFMGSQLYDLMQDNGLSMGDMVHALEAMGDPMLEMSMLDGINDALDALRTYNDDDIPLALLLETALASYLSQCVPTIMGQIERMGEDYRQTTYTNPDSALPTSVQRKISQMFAKVPGLDIPFTDKDIPDFDYQQQDYIDAWGRKQEAKKGIGAFFENFLSPGYTSADRSTPVDDELQRLYDAGMGDVFPSYAPRNPGGNIGRLSPEEYETYATTRGQTSLSLVQDFIESEQYKDLSDSERADIIKNLYTLANNSAKTAVMRQREDGYSGVEKGDYATALTDAGMYTADVFDYIFGIAEDGTPTQKELQAYYKEHPDEADYIGALWDAAHFTGKDTATWETYLKSLKGK